VTSVLLATGKPPTVSTITSLAKVATQVLVIPVQITIIFQTGLLVVQQLHADQAKVTMFRLQMMETQSKNFAPYVDRVNILATPTNPTMHVRLVLLVP
jgi:hypothetical protein